MNKESSDLSYVDVNESDPIQLFKRWNDAVVNAGCSLHYIMCVATSNKNGRVSNRNVVLQDIKEDGFIFSTTTASRKYQDILENPYVASTVIWHYQDQEDKSVTRQVRFEGAVEEFSADLLKPYYEKAPFYSKIRDHLGHQGMVYEWDDMKKRHDALVQDVQNNKKTLPMPNNYIGYKIVPEQMDFLYELQNCVPDRVVFTKESNKWKYERMCT